MGATRTALVYGTGNAAKLAHMRRIAEPLGIEIIGINELGIQLPDIDESGSDPLKNARIKAAAYYNAVKRPVFSCDSGLFINGLDADLQPGVHVRNIGDKRLNDDEMIAHYAALAETMGGQMTSRYKNAICLVLSDREAHEHMGDDIVGEEFVIVSTPHPKRVEGFPIDSLSVHIQTGAYYYDMDAAHDVASTMDEGFRNFFIRSLKL